MIYYLIVPRVMSNKVANGTIKITRVYRRVRETCSLITRSRRNEGEAALTLTLKWGWAV